MTTTLVRPQETNFGTAHSLPLPLDEAWGRGTAPTAVPDPRAIDPEVVDVLFEWGALTNEEPEVRIVEPPADAVEAVAYLERVLNISQDRVLDAVGIAPRTFFGWKTEGRRARTSSVGVIWSMVQVLSGIDAVRGDLVAWFHSSPEVRARFDAGDANGIALLDAERSFRSGRTIMPVPVTDATEVSAGSIRPTRRTLVSTSSPNPVRRTRPTPSDG